MEGRPFMTDVWTDEERAQTKQDEKDRGSSH